MHLEGLIRHFSVSAIIVHVLMSFINFLAGIKICFVDGMFFSYHVNSSLWDKKFRRKYFRTSFGYTLFFYKNKVYKNIEAQSC